MLYATEVERQNKYIYIYIHTERLCSMQEVTINGNSPEIDVNLKKKCRKRQEKVTFKG